MQWDRTEKKFNPEDLKATREEHPTVSHQDRDPEDNTLSYRDPLFHERWSITQRVGVFLAGIGFLITSNQTKGKLRPVFLGLALASFIRSLSNLHVTPLLGKLFNPAMTLKREVEIRAPIEHVFMFLKSFSNYPTFMSFVKRVEINDQGSLTWTLEGPLGLVLQFDAYLAQLIPNQKIAWISCPSSMIKNAGEITLHEDQPAITRLCIELSYAPPLGIVGYLILNLIGYNPKSKIQADLIRLKALLEEAFVEPFQTEDEAA